MIQNSNFHYIKQIILVLLIAGILFQPGGRTAAQSTSLMDVPASSGGDFELNWFTVDSGGGTSQGGDFSISGTIGQPDPGSSMAGGDFELSGGFWGAGFIHKTITEMKEILLPLITR